MAGSAGDTLRHVADNPTGAGDIPRVSTDQVDNVSRPGGREHKPMASPESPDVPQASRPGGFESTKGAEAADAPTFARPGGAQGWGS